VSLDRRRPPRSARATYWLVRAGAWLIPRLPVWLANALGDLAGEVGYRFAGGSRRNLVANLRELVFASVPEPERSARVRQTARQCFRTVARNYIDMFRIPRVSATQLDRRLHVDGWHHVDDALAHGKGLIVCMAHFGNVDFVGQSVVQRGYRTTVPMEVPADPRLWDLLLRLRGSQGFTLLPVEGSLRTLVRALRRNEIVGMAVDFLPTGARGVPVRFFGQVVRLPDGAAGLGRLSGAPLCLGFVRRLPDNTFVAHVEPPFEVPRTDDERADLLAGTQHIARILERQIAGDPGQWVLFRRLPIEPTAMAGRDADVSPRQGEATRLTPVAADPDSGRGQ
jgi:KDO2-lipid IV(A) lauroyltransferase